MQEAAVSASRSFPRRPRGRGLQARESLCTVQAEQYSVSYQPRELRRATTPPGGRNRRSTSHSYPRTAAGPTGFPWTITYRFQAHGQEYEGKTTTLRPVGFTHQPGQPTYVLYLEDDPAQNAIYPPVM